MTTPPLHIDFLSPKMQYRRKQASLHKEVLAKAIGISPQKKPFIVDATAGLGRDSFILACLGYEVTMLERSEILYEALRDALWRAEQVPELAPVVHRMHLIHGDAIEWLRERIDGMRCLNPPSPNPFLLLSQEEGEQCEMEACGEPPDVIYLDPMFPGRQKSALVKKDMRLLQTILGKDEDADQLLEMALACAKQRVVVKRPRLAPPLAGKPPSFEKPGKTSRFDIYVLTATRITY